MKRRQFIALLGSAAAWPLAARAQPADRVRPGENITGFTNFEASIGGKWLELLKEIAPGVVRVAFLYNPRTAPYADGFVRTAEAAAVSYHMELVPSPVQTDAEIASALAALA